LKDRRKTYEVKQAAKVKKWGERTAQFKAVTCNTESKAKGERVITTETGWHDQEEAV
jgi:hypothetical protein